MDRFFELVLFFMIYSFIGWLCESIYCSFLAGHAINRGFLSGPVCPVYGFGGLLVIGTLYPLRNNLLLLFAAAMLLTSVLEYLTALALEKIFHTKYWDYSNQFLNLQGRVCLWNSLLFGAMSVIGVTLIHPALLTLIMRIHPPVRALIAILMLFLIALDTALSANAMLSLNGKLDELQKVFDEIRQRALAATAEKREALQSSPLIDRLDEATKNSARLLYESRTKLGAVLGSVQRRMIRAFPHMQSLRSNEPLQHVRTILQSGVRFVSDTVPAAISARKKRRDDEK